MPRTKTFSIKMGDLPNMVDAIFAGDHDDPGWVEMNANDKGRACVNALFPDARIAWRESGNGAPADWHGFIINIPDVVAEMETALPLDIARGADLDEANPDALALLLARRAPGRPRGLPPRGSHRDRSPPFGTLKTNGHTRCSRRHRGGRCVGGDRKTAWTAISGRFAHPLPVTIWRVVPAGAHVRPIYDRQRRGESLIKRKVPRHRQSVAGPRP
jgi:hypothetical protein